MACRLFASRAASLLKSPAIHCRFSSGSIDEFQLNQEMKKLISGDYSCPKTNCNKSIIKTFKFHEYGKWLMGSNIYVLDGGEDVGNTDKRRLAGGIRYVVDKHGIILGIKVFENIKDPEVAKYGANWFNALPS